ncbi:hypothetical protein [Ligilactobacillus salivarius]|uniref:hypothetical protein n=1 Tax=Ligilactobacillus salivarius TaxID=1624 RepID=UPI002361C09A|nr:hypothetical protein [Ligilactobacillus salivarius]MDD1403575.1 hypothetical protein [Ligilactobacillus salivarius]
MFITACIFGNVDISKSNSSIKITGIVPYFINRKFKKALQNEQLRSVKIKNDREETQLKKEQLELKHLKLKLSETDVQKIQGLKLTNSEVGNEIPAEMQIDNLSDIADLSEIKKAPEKK